MLDQFCIFHKDSVITHFCRASSCCMPLCADCLNDHCQQHYGHRESPQIQKLSSTYSDVLKISRGLFALFGQNYSELKDFYEQRVKEPRLSEQLGELKTRVYRIIDMYFEDIQKEIVLVEERESVLLDEQLSRVEQFIKGKNSEVERIAGKIEGPKGIKHMIQLLDSQFVEQAKQDSSKCSQFLKQLKLSLPSLVTPHEQLNELTAHLHKLLKIKNQKLYNTSNSSSLHPLEKLSNVSYVYPPNNQSDNATQLPASISQFLKETDNQKNNNIQYQDPAEKMNQNYIDNETNSTILVNSNHLNYDNSSPFPDPANNNANVSSKYNHSKHSSLNSASYYTLPEQALQQSNSQNNSNSNGFYQNKYRNQNQTLTSQQLQQNKVPLVQRYQEQQQNQINNINPPFSRPNLSYAGRTHNVSDSYILFPTNPYQDKSYPIY